MKQSEFKKIKKVHCVGIGGIGISALAAMMLMSGKKVSGSDDEETPIIDELRKKGAHIFKGHHKENILPETELVIYTIAIKRENPELEEARARGIKILSYPQALGVVSQEKFTIAIAGTHGKTTTTAMLGKIVSDAGLSPTIIIGSFLKDEGSNFISGKSEIFIVEACEYKRSFLHLSPDILVITNIDNDHLDYYGDLRGVQKGFSELVDKMGSGNCIITNPTNSHIAPVLKNATSKIIDYTLYNGSELHLKLPGEHNIQNAKAALAVTEILNISLVKALSSLNQFNGTCRRFELKGKMLNGALVYDDYAHHPTEIKATLKASKEFFSDRRIVVVFQPHLYSRTQLLIDEFATSFDDADEVLIAPIYSAREDDQGMDVWLLAEKIRVHNSQTTPFYNIDDIEAHLLSHTKGNDVIITMGAGDIYTLGEKLITY